MKAARMHGIKDFRIDEVERPTPKGREILIKVEACGICGSDLPRIYELGTSKHRYPLILGHEFGGKIVEVGEEADKNLIGQRGAIFPCIPCMKCESCQTGNYAMCLDYDYLGSRSDGGFAEYCLVPSDWHFIPAKDSVSSQALAMIEPCTVAQHALRKSHFAAGYSCLIFGAGPIGIMAARWAEIFGSSKVVLVDINEEKISFAKERGVVCLNAMDADFQLKLLEANNNKKFDVVIEGTGTGVALSQSIEAVRTFGTVLMMGNPHKDTTIKLASHSNILRKEVTLQGMWNSHYHDSPINEWHYSMQAIAEGKMIVDDLVTHKSELDNLDELIDDIYTGKLTICKAMFSKVE